MIERPPAVVMMLKGRPLPVRLWLAYRMYPALLRPVAGPARGTLRRTVSTRWMDGRMGCGADRPLAPAAGWQRVE